MGSSFRYPNLSLRALRLLRKRQLSGRDVSSESNESFAFGKAPPACVTSGSSACVVSSVSTALPLSPQAPDVWVQHTISGLAGLARTTIFNLATHACLILGNRRTLFHPHGSGPRFTPKRGGSRHVVLRVCPAVANDRMTVHTLCSYPSGGVPRMQTQGGRGLDGRHPPRHGAPPWSMEVGTMLVSAEIVPG
jgi:hypothetical protein